MSKTGEGVKEGEINPDRAGDTEKSNFNFFATVEDTIKGVIEFLIKFVKVSLKCIFRPAGFVRSYKEGGDEIKQSLPRPYTYLMFSIICFVKGIGFASSWGRTVDDEVPGLGILDAAQSLAAMASEITSLQIFLNVLPAFIVIVGFAFFFAFLFKRSLSASSLETSYIFSYLFGAQAIGVLSGMILLKFVSVIPDTGKDIAAFGMVVSGVWLLISASNGLNAWFSGAVQRKVIAELWWVFFFGLSLIITSSYFASIIGARQKIEKADRYGSTGYAGVTEHLKNEISLTVFNVEIKQGELELTLLLNNRGKNDYYVYDRASFYSLGGYDKVIDEAIRELSKINDGDSIKQKVSVSKLYNKYKNDIDLRMFKMDLKVEPGSGGDVTVIEAGKRTKLKYIGDITNRGIKSKLLFAYIKIPVGRLNNNGEVDYASIDEILNYISAGVSGRLLDEKKKNDAEIDKTINEMNKNIPSMMKQLLKDNAVMVED